MARDLCIFMKEVGWNPDRTVMNENSSPKMSNDILFFKCFIHRVLSGGTRKVNKVIFRKKILSKIVPEAILK